LFETKGASKENFVKVAAVIIQKFIGQKH